jgi:hypothetical protein
MDTYSFVLPIVLFPSTKYYIIHYISWKRIMLVVLIHLIIPHIQPVGPLIVTQEVHSTTSAYYCIFV